MNLCCCTPPTQVLWILILLFIRICTQDFRHQQKISNENFFLSQTKTCQWGRAPETFAIISPRKIRLRKKLCSKKKVPSKKRKKKHCHSLGLILFSNKLSFALSQIIEIVTYPKHATQGWLPPANLFSVLFSPPHPPLLGTNLISNSSAPTPSSPLSSSSFDFSLPEPKSEKSAALKQSHVVCITTSRLS